MRIVVVNRRQFVELWDKILDPERSQIPVRASSLYFEWINVLVMVRDEVGKAVEAPEDWNPTISGLMTMAYGVSPDGDERLEGSVER